MSDEIIEKKYLSETLDLVKLRLNNLRVSSKKLEGVFDESNKEYFEYLKNNANKMNDDDFVEIVNYQNRLNALEEDSIDNIRMEGIYNKMLNKPYFASILINENGVSDIEKYYIGLNSLVDDNKNFKVVDWRSPIASIFYDYEKGKCQIKTNSSILHCDLLNKRQYGIENGELAYFFDSTINIEDEILKKALAENTSNKMKSIVETIQKEQNLIIRGDENKNLIVQGVAGSGKTAIALHRIAYLLYKMKGKLKSQNIMFLSPNNAFSSYISSVLPELAEEDVEKLQLDLYARKTLKKHCIVERRYEQIERLIDSTEDNDYIYKTSYKFLEDLLKYAKQNYIDNFNIDSLKINNIEIDVNKIHNLFFDRYSDRDLFTRFKWITDNIFDIYFFKYKKPETVVKIKELIFSKLYSAIKNKNCIKAYMQFLDNKGLKLELVGDKVKNEDVYGILFFKQFIYGLDKFTNIKHLVIDEMQDYSPVQMYILNYLFDCPKTILGDYNQSINTKCTKKNFEDLDKVLGDESSIIKINKSYRSTMQIASFYNMINTGDRVDVVSRSGDQVDFVLSTEANIISKINDLIEKYKANGYTSIGIITKNNDIAKKLFNKICSLNSEITLIDDNIDNYDNKVCIISAFNSKGLEFDGVIIIDSDKYYRNDIDRNILFVASTRALHKLSILSLDKESDFIKEIKEKL